MTIRSDAAVWVVRAGRKSRWASEFESMGLIAIGFPPVGDLRGKSRDDVVKIVSSDRPAKRERVAGEAGMLYQFASEIQAGDVVITPDGSTRELLFGEVVGPYGFREPPVFGEFRHVRKVEWKTRRSRDELPQRILYSLGGDFNDLQAEGSREAPGPYDG